MERRVELTGVRVYGERFYVKIRTGIKEEMGFMKKNMNGFTDRRWVI